MKTTKFCLQVDEAGRQHTIPLQHSVSRLGHSESCEIQLKTHTAHAATVILQSGNIMVINRTATAIRCGKSAIRPGERHIWGTGDVLALEGIRITLAGEKKRNPAQKRLEASPDANTKTSDAQNRGASSLQTTGNIPKASTSSRSRLHVVVLMVCGFAMTAMLMGSRTLSVAQENKKILDECLSDIHAGIEQTRQQAEIHDRLSTLAELINRAERASNDSQIPINPDAKVLVFCRSLAATDDRRVTSEERQLAERFVAVLGRREKRPSGDQVQSLEDCVTDLFATMGQHRHAAEVHSRMTSLADAICRCQDSGSGMNAGLAVQRRDAITFCRSLAESKSLSVTEAERRLAKSLVSLIEEGL